MSSDHHPHPNMVIIAPGGIPQEYPGSLGGGPEGYAAAQAAAKARAEAPPTNIYEPELGKLLGVRDVKALYISHLAANGFPLVMIRRDLQKFPTPAVETFYWDRFSVMQWIPLHLELAAMLKIKQ